MLKNFPTYPEGGQNDSSDLLLDRLLQDVGEGRHHVIASQLLAELRAEGKQPHTEDHLVLQLEATLVAQHCCDAKTERETIREKNRKPGKNMTKKRAGNNPDFLFSNGEALSAVRARSPLPLSLLMTKIEMSRKSLGDGRVLMTTARQTCHTFAKIAAE